MVDPMSTKIDDYYDHDDEDEMDLDLFLALPEAVCDEEDDEMNKWEISSCPGTKSLAHGAIASIDSKHNDESVCDIGPSHELQSGKTFQHEESTLFQEATFRETEHEDATSLFSLVLSSEIWKFAMNQVDFDNVDSDDFTLSPLPYRDDSVMKAPQSRSSECTTNQEPSGENHTTVEIGPNDVILGRGYCFNNLQGNRRFRDLIRSRMHIYHADPSSSAFRGSKIEISEEVVGEIHRRGGKFLKRNLKEGRANGQANPSKLHQGTTWRVVEKEVARRKVSQRFRLEKLLAEKRKKQPR